jgi:hypothetical protein
VAVAVRLHMTVGVAVLMTVAVLAIVAVLMTVAVLVRVLVTVLAACHDTHHGSANPLQPPPFCASRPGATPSQRGEPGGNRPVGGNLRDSGPGNPGETGHRTI